MLVTGIVGFTAVSVLAALSQSLGRLITARAVLGLFAALVFLRLWRSLPSSFPRARCAAAIGIWAATSGIAVAIGPVLGGWLLEHYSWSSVFWINLPVGVVAVTTILLVVPGTRPDAVNRFDFVGLALSIIGRPRRADLLGHRGPTLRVEQRPHHRRHRRGRARPRAVRPPPTRRRLPDPRRAPVQQPVLRHRGGNDQRRVLRPVRVHLPDHPVLPGRQRYGPLEAGLWTLPFALVMAVFSPVAMALSHRFGPRPVAITAPC